MKALLCVGGAYFVMGVIAPLFALGPNGMTGFNQTGIINATIGGALGALGAIFIIYAFKNGGVPTYVMPLVFGGAPIINTLFTMTLNPPKDSINPLMWLGMIMVPVGAAMVLFLPSGALVRLRLTFFEKPLRMERSLARFTTPARCTVVPMNRPERFSLRVSVASL